MPVLRGSYKGPIVTDSTYRGRRGFIWGLRGVSEDLCWVYIQST